MDSVVDTPAHTRRAMVSYQVLAMGISISLVSYDLMVCVYVYVEQLLWHSGTCPLLCPQTLAIVSYTLLTAAGHCMPVLVQYQSTCM